MRGLRLICVGTMLCAAGWAQSVVETSTLITPILLRFGAADAGAGAGTVQFVAKYGNKFLAVKLGQGLQFRLPGNGEIILEASAVAAPATVLPQIGLRATKQTDGTWQVTAPTGVVLTGPVVVYLNGIRQSEGVDFTRLVNRPNAVVPVPNSALDVLPMAGSPAEWEIVVFDYPAARGE